MNAMMAPVEMAGSCFARWHDDDFVCETRDAANLVVTAPIK